MELNGDFVIESFDFKLEYRYGVILL